jgi:hypothetical protein
VVGKGSWLGMSASTRDAMYLRADLVPLLYGRVQGREIALRWQGPVLVQALTRLADRL